MSRAKDILLGGLALCSGVLGIVVWRQQVELRELTRANGRVAASAASTMTVRAAANRSFVVPPRTSEAARTDMARSGIVPGEDGGGIADERPRAAARRGGSALARLMDNPEFVEALTLQRHAMLDVRFGELFRRLNLEGEKLAAFKRLLAEKENVALDVVTVSETSPEGPLSAESLRAGVRAAQSQIEVAIQNSLGTDRYAVYRDYERTVAQRATVAQLEQRLSYTRMPLTPAQAEAVVRILESNTPKPADNPVPPVSVLVRAGVPEAVPILPTSAATGRVTDEVVTQAQTVLAPPQLEALREIQDEQQAAVKAAQMIRDVAPAATEVLPTWPTLLLH